MVTRHWLWTSVTLLPDRLLIFHPHYFLNNNLYSEPFGSYNHYLGTNVLSIWLLTRSTVQSKAKWIETEVVKPVESYQSKWDVNKKPLPMQIRQWLWCLVISSNVWRQANGQRCINRNAVCVNLLTWKFSTEFDHLPENHVPCRFRKMR